MAISSDDLVEDVTEDGFHIIRETAVDMLLWAYYTHYNQSYFNGSLPSMPLHWAKRIILPDGKHANALYVSEEAPVKRRYIAIDKTLSDMFPLERLCLLHEMVHVKVGPEVGHGEEFITEFKRVLDADKWAVMGCLDAPAALSPE
jgi:hypothetical protein